MPRSCQSRLAARGRGRRASCYGVAVARSPLRVVSDQARAFAEALAAAPEPTLSRDLWGMRRLLHRLAWVLWHEKTGPRELAIAVFVGVLIGCSPFYGLHTLLVVVFGFLLGVNKIVMWVASNVSLPFIAPFIAFGSMQVGHLVVHGEPLPMTLEGARELAASASIVDVGIALWLDWLAGSVFVGSGLGAVFAAATWRVAIQRESAKRAAETSESDSAANMSE